MTALVGLGVTVGVGLGVTAVVVLGVADDVGVCVGAGVRRERGL